MRTQRDKTRRKIAAAVGALVLACSVLVGSMLTHVGPAAASGDLNNASVALTAVATGLTKPVALAWRLNDSRMYVAEQTGTVRIVAANGTPVSTPVLTQAVSGGNEQGLLGLAFSADGTKLYVDYTDTGGDIHVDEYTMNGDVANTATKRQLLLQEHSQFSNHNGGEVVFGPDGMLYIGLGDGGSAGDPNGNGQNLNTWLGKILRIDPTPNGGNPYTVPGDNPFVGQSPKLPENWMYGLRNPWRFSFDRLTGDAWIGDVGQNLYEEIDVANSGVGGVNWGWGQREGFHPYNGGAQPSGGQDPVIELPHTGGYCAVIGGYVYRGSAIADLDGAYVFGDSCRSSLVGATVSGGTVSLQRDLGVSVSQLTTFGEDPSGELYAAARTGTVYKLTQGAIATTSGAVSVGDVSVVEGDSGTRSLSFPVTLSGASTVPITADYTVTSGSATGASTPGAGVDFKTMSGTVTFTPGVSGESPVLKYITVPVYGDTTDDPNTETFTVTLSNVSGSGFVPGDTTGTGTIIDDDPGAGLRAAVGDAGVVEGDSGSRTVKIPVTVSAAPGAATVSVPYTISGVNATWSKSQAAGGDFGGATSGTLTFTGAAVLKTISVPAYGDQTAELNETIHVNLGSVSGAANARSVGTITIQNDDSGTVVTPPAPTMSVGDMAVLEGDSGTRSVMFPVTLSQASTVTVTAHYAVMSGSATGGSAPGSGIDFKTSSGTVTFAPAASGESPVVKYVSVPTYGDTTTPEGNETFTVTLSSVSGGSYAPGDTSGTGTIVNDDSGTGLRVGVGDATVVEGDSGTRTLKISVTISAAPGGTTVSVPFTVAGVDATWSKTQAGGGDYAGPTSGTLTFTGAAVSKTISIPVYGDRSAESNETANVTLGAVSGAASDRSVGTITIQNDD